MHNVIFRTDASQIIGTGHVMRCLTLAEKLKGQNTVVTFICREHQGHLCELIQQCGFSVILLPTSKNSSHVNSEPTQFSWIGASWQDDAEQTVSAIATIAAKPSWLIVDHYALDFHWENALRAAVDCIMVIDDLADRVHNCDLLLDQNLVDQMQTRYPGKVPKNCTVLLGPEFSLLQPIYAELHDSTPPRKGAIKRILIFFGGVDKENMTGRTLTALVQLKRPDIMVDVVITSSNPHTEKIRKQIAGQDNICLHSDLPTLAPLMVIADLALGAGGATSLERLCLGLPTLVVTLADNQCLVANRLSQLGLIRLLGHKDMVDESTLIHALDEMLQQALDGSWSLRCFAVVDGLGVNRVCAAMSALEVTPLRVRYATLKDEAILLKWANDPETRSNAFDQEPIASETHRAWLRSHLNNLDQSRFYIVETNDGDVLGQVRFQNHGDGWEIHYSLAPIFRRRGLGRHLLGASLSKFSSDIVGVLVFGQVKTDNLPSQKIFKALGFMEDSKSSNLLIYSLMLTADIRVRFRVLS